MSPAEADECELWQLAVLLGRDRPAELSEIERLEARVQEEKETLRGRGRSEPEPDSEDGPRDVTAEIMRQMGISTR